MPHIICYNISPRTSDGGLTQKDLGWGSSGDMPRWWREQLEPVIVKTTAEFWGLPPEDVTCSFPYDPSVPTDPYPLATVIVELLFDKPERTQVKRAAYADKLAYAVKQELDRLRRTTDAKVEVAVKRFDPNKDGFFVTK